MRKKKRKIISILPNNFFSVKEFFGYIFIVALSTVLFIGFSLLEESTVFESYIILLTFIIGLFWIGRYILFRQHSMFILPSMLVFAGLLIKGSFGTLTEVSFYLAFILIIICLFDCFGLWYYLAEKIINKYKLKGDKKK